MVGLLLSFVGFIGLFVTFGGLVGSRETFPVAVFIEVLLLGAGLVLSFLNGRRWTLIITAKKTEFSWTENHIFAGPGSSMFEEARLWAQNNGLPLDLVSDSVRTARHDDD